MDYFCQSPCLLSLLGLLQKFKQATRPRLGKKYLLILGYYGICQGKKYATRQGYEETSFFLQFGRRKNNFIYIRF